MRQFFNVILFLVFTSLIFIACDDTKITDPPIPTENVSYAQHIQPIIAVIVGVTIHKIMLVV